MSSSVAPHEIDQFSKLSGAWWNSNGPLGILHRLNPVRLGYIRDQLTTRASPTPLKGLRGLDAGCGGGVLTEPLCRLGASMVGLDASKDGIEAAKAHAKQSGLTIDYRTGDAETLAQKEAGKFDFITALEVLEHVADRQSFIAALAKMLKPGGVLITATVNRTPKSFALGIVAAEYVLNWVPKGTHDWRKFVKPSELAADMTACDLNITDISGVVYNPLTHDFALKTGSTAVNYMMAARR